MNYQPAYTKIEKYEDPAGDGNSYLSSSAAFFMIEKYEDPAGDGNRNEIDLPKYSDRLRNTKTPQGTETALVSYDVSVKLCQY